METKIEGAIEKRLANNNYTGAFQKSMDVMQIELDCCGVLNAKSYDDSLFHKYVSF